MADDVKKLFTTNRKGVHGPNNLARFLNGMSPEERAAHQKHIQEKAAQTRARKKAERAEAKEKAKELIPVLMAEEMILSENENMRPSQALINKTRELIDKGMSIEALRTQLFGRASEKAWNNFKRYLFQDQISQAEDLGLEILNVKKRAITTLKKRIRELKKLIKESRANGRPYLTLMEMKATAEDKLLDIELDVSKTLYSVGAVGKKKGSTGGVTVNFNIPRPPADVAKVVHSADFED